VKLNRKPAIYAGNIIRLVMNLLMSEWHPPDGFPDGPIEAPKFIMLANHRYSSSSPRQFCAALGRDIDWRADIPNGVYNSSPVVQPGQEAFRLHSL
jgi:hypothetical protein